MLGFALDGDVSQSQRRGVVEVEAVHRRGLIVPLILTGLRMHRDDRGGEQVVATARRTQLRRPRYAIAGAEDYQVGLRVVDDAIPGAAATALLPPLAVPGLC